MWAGNAPTSAYLLGFRVTSDALGDPARASVVAILLPPGPIDPSPWGMPKSKIEDEREVIMTKQAIDAVAAWRTLEPSEKLRIRQSVVIDRVVASMAMEGEPVSQEWISQAKARRAQLVASTPPEAH
jgi:hypothetical protein